MSELTLEALGYRQDEATIARRIHDLTHTPQQRAAAQRGILGRRRLRLLRARAIHPQKEMHA